MKANCSGVRPAMEASGSCGMELKLGGDWLRKGLLFGEEETISELDFPPRGENSLEDLGGRFGSFSSMEDGSKSDPTEVSS